MKRRDTAEGQHDAPAVHVFTRDANRYWTQVAYLKASNAVIEPGTYVAETLTDAQESQLRSWITIFAKSREIQWLQYQSGVIDEATWASYSAPLSIVFAPEFARSYWQQRLSKDGIDPGFVEYMNARVIQ